jgi:glycosyltransferase involved in cell wall biosynthesis
MQELAAELDLEGVVHFAGLWPDTSQVYPGLDLLVQTSRIEGLPLSLLEGMACGLPVVAIGVGGVPEIVEEGHTGMLAGPGDWRGVGQRAVDLLEHPARMQEMGAAGRRRAETQFDLRVTVKQTTDLMERLVQAAQVAHNGVLSSGSHRSRARKD